MIQIILSIPAATDWTEVPVLFAEAGYSLQLPSNGVMPSSAEAGGRVLLHGVVSGASYQQILDLIADQRPTFQVFGAIDGLESANPAYDPDVPETIEVDGEEAPNPAYEPPTRAVVHEPLNAQVWNFLPNRLDSEGNATIPQTKLHQFQGLAPFEGR